MKLTHPLFSRPIVFRENRVPVLVVEEPCTFRRLALDLIGQSEGLDGEFVLSRNDCCLDCGDSLRVFQDYAHLENVDRRVQTKALSALLRAAQEVLPEEALRLSRQLQEYLSKLALLSDAPVAYEQSENLPSLLKAMDFRVDLSGLTPCEALLEQLLLAQRFLKEPCIGLIHARTYFSAEEMRQLYASALYHKLHLMLLEARAPEPPLPDEELRLYDRDLCELTLDSPDEIL